MKSRSLSVCPGAINRLKLGIQGGWLALVAYFFFAACTAIAQADASADEPKSDKSAPAQETATEESQARSPKKPPAEPPAASSDEKRAVYHIGPVATITEVSSGLPFPARVDTGARVCAIHYEDLKIVDPAKKPEDNVGKQVRILLKNSEGEKEWIDSKIVAYVTVRTTTKDDPRYKVRLNLRWQDVEKKVSVTLSDRDRMTYPLLLGRNFLRGDFLVDVNLQGEE